MKSRYEKKNLVGDDLEKSITRFRISVASADDMWGIEKNFENVLEGMLSLMNQHKYGVLYNIIRKNCF